jgi:hypothetical protein
MEMEIGLQLHGDKTKRVITCCGNMSPKEKGLGGVSLAGGHCYWTCNYVKFESSYFRVKGHLLELEHVQKCL